MRLILNNIQTNFSPKFAGYYSIIAFLKSEGEQPLTCLKTRLKVLMLLKPESKAISRIESDEFINRLAAFDTL